MGDQYTKPLMSDLPGSPVVKMLCVQCREFTGLLPGQETEIPHIMKLGVRGMGMGGGTLRKRFTFFPYKHHQTLRLWCVFIEHASVHDDCLPSILRVALVPNCTDLEQ